MADSGDDKKSSSPFKPNIREIVGEGYKVIFLAVLSSLAVVVAKIYPPVSEHLEHNYVLPLYQLVLIMLGVFVVGCVLTIFFQGDLIRRLRNLTRHDERTGLLNLRAFNEIIEPTIQYARAHKEPLAIIFLDIDDFKKLNTDYGYDTGSFVLQQISQLLTFNPRKRDCFFRYGGDEILLLVPNTIATGGLMYAQTIRNNIKNTPFKAISEGIELNITISGGIAELDISKGHIRDTFVWQAEAALNRAKKKKNEVLVYDEKIDGTAPNR